MTRPLGLISCILLTLGLTMMGCGGGGSSSSPDMLQSGLIHWWKLDGNGGDSAGSLNGVVRGPMTFSTGIYGQAAVGNGQTTGIAIPDSTDMQLQGPFTLSAWVNTTAPPSSGQLTEAIFFRGDDRSGADPVLLCVNHSSQIIFEVDGDASSDSLIGPVSFGKFVLVTAINNPTTGQMRLYENGQLVASNSSAVTPVKDLDPTAHPGIGIDCNNDFPNSSFNFSFNGAVDDVRVYNRQLSDAEVLALYNQGVASALTTGAPH